MMEEFRGTWTSDDIIELARESDVINVPYYDLYKFKTRESIKEWCRGNCTGKWYVGVSRVWFQEDRDRQLFVLTWC